MMQPKYVLLQKKGADGKKWVWDFAFFANDALLFEIRFQWKMYDPFNDSHALPKSHSNKSLYCFLIAVGFLFI